MSDMSATDPRPSDGPSTAEVPPITAGEMFSRLIASGHIVTPEAGYSQPTVPSAYRIVPSITAAHSIPTAMRPEPG